MSPTFETVSVATYYNPRTHKVVPKDAVVLDPERDLSAWETDPAKLRYYADRLDEQKVGLAGASLLRKIAERLTPPRIPEPGIGSRVLDSKGFAYTRFSDSENSVLGDWINEDGLIRRWDAIDSPTLIRPGV